MIDMIVENNATVSNNENNNNFTTINTMEQAVQTANEIERLEAVLSHLKEQLKAFVEVNGAVKTDTKIYDFSEYVSYSFTSENLKKFAEQLVIDGKDPWEYLSMTATNIKKTGWKESAVLEFASKKVSRQFKSHKLR